MRIHEVTPIRLGRTDNSRALAMIDELNELTDDHPFSPENRILGGATFHISPTRQNRVHIHDIMSLEPNKGHATRAIRFLQKLANKHNVGIELFAKAYRDDRMSTEELIKWYTKLGFKLWDDPEEIDLDDGAEMRYIPGYE